MSRLLLLWLLLKVGATSTLEEEVGDTSAHAIPRFRSDSLICLLRLTEGRGLGTESMVAIVGAEAG